MKMFRCTDHESDLGGRGSGDPVPCVRRPVDRARLRDGRSVPAQAPGGAKPTPTERRARNSLASAVTRDRRANTNLMYPRTQLPMLTDSPEPETHTLICAVYADSEAACPYEITKEPLAHVESL